MYLCNVPYIPYIASDHELHTVKFRSIRKVTECVQLCLYSSAFILKWSSDCGKFIYDLTLFLLPLGKCNGRPAQVFTALWGLHCLSSVMQALTVIRLAFMRLLAFVLLVSTALKAHQTLMLHPVILDISVPEAPSYPCPACRAHWEVR